MFIVLGDPDQAIDQSAEVQNQGRVIVWYYPEYHLQLTFQDVSGFGRFQLTPTSRSEFDRIKARVQAQQRLP